MDNLCEIKEYGKVDEYVQGKAKKAYSAFLEGHNCAQALLIAFEECIRVPISQVLRLAQPLGGGFSRLREVCGAVSGGVLVLGALFGSDNPKDHKQKKVVYELTQSFAKRYESINGSYICGELLGLSTKDSPVPEKRNLEYYTKRPCANLVGIAAGLVAQIIQQNT